MPAKFDATPENVSNPPLMPPGSLPRLIAAASAKRSDSRKTPRPPKSRWRWKTPPGSHPISNSRARLFSVTPPSGVRNAPRTIFSVGRIRNRSAKMKNGTTPSHLSGKVLRAARGGRSLSCGDMPAAPALNRGGSFIPIIRRPLRRRRYPSRRPPLPCWHPAVPRSERRQPHRPLPGAACRAGPAGILPAADIALNRIGWQ